MREQFQLPSAHYTKVTVCFIMDERNPMVCGFVVVVVFKHFCDEILEDILLMASH